jgi:adenylate kinase
MNLVLLGAPGSGKGTQAERLQAEFSLTHVSSGDLFRDNLARDTPLGLKAREYMNRGELVPDDLTIEMVKERLGRSDIVQGVILDGFPRTLPQAEELDRMMASLDLAIDGVLYIEVPDDEIVDRLAGRLICRECQTPFHETTNPFRTCPTARCRGEYLYRRDDDKPETVRARLETFHERTAPLIDYYRKAGRLVSVAGSGPIDQVTRRTLDAARKWA